MIKKIILFFTLISFVFFLLIIFKKKEIKFSTYADIKIDKYICRFESQVNNDVYCTFIITNLSKNPFVIVDIKGDENLAYPDTMIKKLINKNDSIFINVRYTPKEKSQNIEKNIVIKSNAMTGDINLKIKGIVR